MNRKIMEALGYIEEIKRNDAGRCTFCNKPITEFRNVKSEKEFKISGWCQDCQDETFGKD